MWTYPIESSKQICLHFTIDDVREALPSQDHRIVARVRNRARRSRSTSQDGVDKILEAKCGDVRSSAKPSLGERHHRPRGFEGGYAVPGVKQP